MILHTRRIHDRHEWSYSRFQIQREDCSTVDFQVSIRSKYIVNAHGPLRDPPSAAKMLHINVIDSHPKQFLRHRYTANTCPFSCTAGTPSLPSLMTGMGGGWMGSAVPFNLASVGA